MYYKIYKSLLSLLALTLVLSTSAQVVINEYSASNLSGFIDNHNKYEDWIELYNAGSSSANISGFGLSDKIDNPFKWVFPEGTSINAGDFIRIWASGRNSVNSQNHFHSNFKLTQTKDNPEHIVLTTPEGVTSDQVQLALTQKDQSRGLSLNGGTEWVLFTSPTPENSNNDATNYQDYTLKPEMSMPAGFYSGGVTVTISTEEPNAQIYYTIDGSKPTSSSLPYAAPIIISSTTILKARTYSANNDLLPGFIEFNTYFIDENHTLGVMSTSAAQLDDLLNGNQNLRPFGTFEYFNAEGERTTFGYGEFNEHGQDSWVHDQRSIDYIARDECGYNYAIREQLIPLTARDEFQRIILRAAGDDNYPGIDTSAHLRDYFVQNTAEKGGMHLDVRKGHKGLLYVNGQYWGIYGYREKVSDHDFTNYYYNQDKYNIYFLKLWGSSWAEYGGQPAWNDWNDLHDFIKSQDMADDDNWEYVKSRFDYKSLVDYVHINSFVVCSDWINWNVGWWRGLNPEGGHQKWGYILWDEDATFAHYINYTGVPGISPYTIPCFPEGLYNDPEEHIEALNQLRDNEEFDQYYISRYVDLYNTVFKPERMIAYLDSIEEMMEPEIHKHVARWGGTSQEWKNNVNKIRNFITDRHDYLPDGFSSCWGLTGPYDFTVTVEPEGVGGVHLNSLDLTEFPFAGKYFGEIDILLEAVESNPNYEFDYWELNNHVVSPNDSTRIITLQLTESDELTAHFKQRLYVDSLVINEINYNSSALFECKDWVEFYNPHLYDLDIEGWIFKDNNNEHEFVFPENTVVEAGGYLVLCRDTVEFIALFPDVENVYGDMDFGLSSNGELIRLYNDENVLIDTVHYENDTPWPFEPNGNGPTLELILPQYNNALPGSWMASPEHGTPGAMNSYWVGIFNEQSHIPLAKITISPNPTHTSATISIESDFVISSGNLQVYNAFGNEVMRIENIKSGQFNFRVEDLPEGLYFLKFTNRKNNIEATGKLVVQ